MGGQGRLEAGGQGAERETTAVPLAFAATKRGAGVTLAEEGKSAASDGSAVGAQLADTWMAGGRKALIWTCAVLLEEVGPDTVVGIAGRNFWPSSWDEEAIKYRSWPSSCPKLMPAL